MCKSSLDTYVTLYSHVLHQQLERVPNWDRNLYTYPKIIKKIKKNDDTLLWLKSWLLQHYINDHTFEKKAKIYIFYCYKSLGEHNKHRLKTKKKLLDRKMEEAVSLAQRSSYSDLIPSWCKAPEDISPPLPTLPSQSEASLDALEAVSAESSCPKRGKKIKQRRRRRKKTHNSPDMLTRVRGLLPQWSVHPGKKKHWHHPQNSPRSPPLHVLPILTG